MYRCRFACFLALLITLTACKKEQTSQACKPEQYGFEEWSVHAELLDQAVKRADAILDPALGLHLNTTSMKHALAGQEITVSQVHGAFVSDGDVALVADEHCLFVSYDWRAQLAPFFGTDTSGTLSVEPIDVLAIILLHELGHIQKRGLADNQAISALISSLGPGKQEEMRADAFAAAQIAVTFKGKGDPGMSATHLTMALTKINWNLQADRMLNNFGTTSLHLSKAFNETGYSHPNLELRFLVINYLVSPNQTSLDLLNGFLDARAHPPGVLYQNPSTPYSLLPQTPSKTGGIRR